MNIVSSPVNTIYVTRTVLLQVSSDQFGHFLLVRSDFNVHCIFYRHFMCLCSLFSSFVFGFSVFMADVLA